VLPYRVAAIRMSEARDRIALLEDDLAKVKKEIEVGETRRSQKLLVDRDKLRRQNEALEGELANVRADMVALQQAQEKMFQNTAITNLYRQQSVSNNSSFLLRLMTYSMFVVLAFFGLFIARGETPYNFYAALPLICIMIWASSVGLVEIVMWLRGRAVVDLRFKGLSSIGASSRVSSVVLMFSDIAQELRPDVRKELIYHLFERVVDTHRSTDASIYKPLSIG
jgi:hypothetical protein